jgi:molybdenum cofactor sulfurtransferase
MHRVLLAMKRRAAVHGRSWRHLGRPAGTAAGSGGRARRAIVETVTDAEARFGANHPECAATRAVDRLRVTEYRRFDDQDHTYLDYTGGGVYAESQLHAHTDLLMRGVFGNPHSGNPASLAMTALVEEARATVLDFFRASPDDYTAIFTPNATGALKLLGEAYPFSAGARYLLAEDNHNSVNGIREFARQRGADIVYAPVAAPDLRLDEPCLRRLLDAPAPKAICFSGPIQLHGGPARLELDRRSAAAGLGCVA